MKQKNSSDHLPDDLLQLIRSFQESRIILTAIELDIFSHIKKEATSKQVSQEINTDYRATEMLLNALTALKLLKKKGDIYSCSEVAEQYLTEGGSDDSRLSLMHSVHSWHNWSHLTECVREGTSVTYQKMDIHDEDWVQAFIAAMDKHAKTRAHQVVNVVGTDGINKMLDIGGGSGAYSIAFASANPHLQVDIFDLPKVIPIAKRHIEKAGLTEQIKTRVGDMHKDDFGTGYDLIFISAICHMNSPQQNLELLQKSFEALNPQGKVVIQDFILNADKTSPQVAAIFSLNMLVVTQAGASYSDVEYRQWLEKTGFTSISRIPLAGPTDLMIGIHP
ncbi:MAG: methyltransferase domain-containing protein [FCB group bacterium]|nr:methyltransferase domain-containing protein [FCB group bacterium]